MLCVDCIRLHLFLVENEGVGRFPDDLSHLLDVESNMQVDDFMRGLPDDLEVFLLLRVVYCTFKFNLDLKRILAFSEKHLKTNNWCGSLNDLFGQNK